MTTRVEDAIAGLSDQLGCLRRSMDGLRHELRETEIALASLEREAQKLTAYEKAGRSEKRRRD